MRFALPSMVDSRGAPAATSLRYGTFSLGLLATFLLLSCNGPGENGTGPGGPTATPASPAPGAVCSRDLASTAPDLTVLGAESSDFLADRFSLAAGDFNGDGRDDLLIGAPLADGPNNTRTNGGEAYVVFSAATLPARLDLAGTEPGLTVYSEAASDNMGFTVAAGDVNGDGVDDALIGSRFASAEGRASAGKLYVIFGRKDLGGSVDTAAGEQDATVVGIDSGDFLSISLGAGDVNADDVDDLLIGAASADGPDSRREQAGEVYVVLGVRDWPTTIDLSQRAPHLTVFGAQPKDSLANYIAAGDTDGDGRDELILGAPFADGLQGQEDAGRAYIVPVREGGGSLDLASGSGFATVAGAATRDGLGFYVAAGDINGDGLEDALIGARDADGPDDSRNNAGEIHIVLGKPELPQDIDLSVETADVTVYGRDAGDSLGFTVAAGDVNGDGLADILAGAPIADSCDNARTDAGEAHVVFGRQQLPEALDLADGAGDLSFFGIEAGDEAGFSLAAADVNGDGKEDVILGALLADGPENERPDAGEAYVIISGHWPSRQP